MSKREDGAKKNGVHKNYIYKFYWAKQAREGKIAERKKESVFKGVRCGEINLPRRQRFACDVKKQTRRNL